MKWERPALWVWIGLGAVVLCAWCSLISSLGGWVMGQDIARRDAYAEFATAATNDRGLSPLGVMVIRLDRAGPAQRAGIQRGSTITAINGVPIRDPRELRDQLGSYHPGDTVHVKLIRGQNEEEVAVLLAPFPNDSQRAYLGIYYTARADEPADL